MKVLYILEARWHDKINRIRHNELIGVYDDLKKLELAKEQTEKKPHDYKSITFSVNTELQPFHA
jgi:hypothetical protein